MHILGIRHHGPGSARAVARALDEVQPDLVLIEGPPELDALVPLGGSPNLVPPVAALIYAVDEPRRAGFYPMAAFSPEWVALRWAAGRGVTTGFLDLPANNALAAPEETFDGSDLSTDPLGALAAAAGYDDPERWWEDAVEHRYHGLEVFAAVLEAMRELRGQGTPSDVFEARREASMRRVLRTAIASGNERIAVICGAWHAPVLVPDEFPSAAADNTVLRGLRKVKVAATWVPWTSARLARASGYGAGITAPGWYHHLFTVPDDAVVARWMVKVAGLLRDERLDASPAAVIEAVRLAETLAVLRSRPLPGLEELTEASRAVLCGGSDIPLSLVADKLLVGRELGSVPDETPMVPLARDLAAHQKRLRLKPTAEATTLELDLRTASHLERSKLFNRLLALGVEWAVPVATRHTTGTFKESWRLEWRPELSVALVEASGAGTTIEIAADTTIRHKAAEVRDLAELTKLVERSMLADLNGALTAVMSALGERTADQHDTPRLMAAVEPLARVRRYGDVRGADTAAVHDVLEGMLIRIAIGLPVACASLDDSAAGEMQPLVDSVQRAVALVEDAPLLERWYAALAIVADQRRVHGLVAGRAVRLLLDASRIAADDAARRLSLALSRAAEPVAGAAWIEGFLVGDALILLYDHALLGAVDGWVRRVPDTVFDDVLPLLRRAFGGFSAPERRMIGEHVRRVTDGTGAAPATKEEFDRERAERVLPTLRAILGMAKL